MFAHLLAVAATAFLFAAYLTALVVLSLARAVEAGSDLGGQRQAFDRIVRNHFRGEIARTVAVLLGAAFVTGAVLGSLSGAVVYLACLVAIGSYEPPIWCVTLWGFLLSFLTHTSLFLRDASARPLLYKEVFKGDGMAKVHLLVAGLQRLSGAVLSLSIKAWSHLRHPTVFVKCDISSPLVSHLPTPLPAPTCRYNSVGAAPPNVLLISADSLRADRINSRVAPFLSELGQRATTFERAYVTIARTLPSWVTLLTGRFPQNHGVRHMFARWEARWADLAAIPGRFATAGYRTAVISDFAGDNFPRTRLGFQLVDTPNFTFRDLVRNHFVYNVPALHPILRYRLFHRVVPGLRALPYTAEARYITRDALRFIDRVSESPFFLTVFYSTTHFPYAAPSPYYRKFSDPRYRGLYRFGKEYELFGPPEVLSDEDITQIRAVYDGCVASIDDAVRDLYQGLRERGLDQNTIIVVTSDHGESLYEDGHGQGHGDHLFGDEGTHVPLLIVDPRSTAVRHIPDIVRDVDVAPTLCELAGLPPLTGIDGRSLVPLLRGASQEPVFAFAETEVWFADPMPAVPSDWRVAYPDIANLIEIDCEHNYEIVIRKELESLVIEAKHRMVRDMRYKLIYAPTRTGVRWMLFDTVDDPRELHDISSTESVILQRLQSELWNWTLADPVMKRSGDRIVARRSSCAESKQPTRAIRLNGGE